MSAAGKRAAPEETPPVVILAGGLGTRLAEETEVRPKPMVEIGDRPLLWHLMKGYAAAGCAEFLVALGYKGEWIKRYFLEYSRLTDDVTIHLASGTVEPHGRDVEDWIVHLIDTGLSTGTGGRVRRLGERLGGRRFFLTYGDGLCDVDLRALLAFHRRHGKRATVTAVRPPARFGELVLEGDRVTRFTEKPQVGEGWINGGFMVLEPGFLEYLTGDETSLEADGLTAAAADGQLMAFRHPGFWQCMDTLRDKRILEAHWRSARAPWRTWS